MDDTRVYTGLGRISLHPVRYCLCYRHWFAVGVTNRREREQIPSLWWKNLMGLMLRCLGVISYRLFESVPFRGRLASPFIDEGKIQVTRERDKRRGKGFRCHGALCLLHAGPADPVDHDGDGSISLLCSPLALYAYVVSWSWRSILCGGWQG